MEDLGMKMDVLRCDGLTAESVRKPGDIKGHIGPATALVLWGLHLFIGACWRYALAERDPSAPRYTSRTWEHMLPFLPSARWRRLNAAVPLDSIYKGVVGGIFVLFLFPYKQIECTDGVRLGRVVGQHIMQWAHSTLILSCTVLGFVELAALRVRFPPGTSTAAMVVAHITSVVIFMYHQKHEIMDQMVHGLIGYSFLAAAMCGVMELYKPASFIALAGKLYFHMLAGIWLGVVGYMIFGGSPFWEPTWEGQPDISPAMFAPILFAMLMLGLMVFLLLLYTLVDLGAAWSLRGTRSAAQLLAAPAGGEPGGLGLGLGVLGQGKGRTEEREGLLAAHGGGGGEACNGGGRVECYSSGCERAAAERKGGGSLSGRV